MLSEIFIRLEDFVIEIVTSCYRVFIQQQRFLFDRRDLYSKPTITSVITIEISR